MADSVTVKLGNVGSLSLSCEVNWFDMDVELRDSLLAIVDSIRELAYDDESDLVIDDEQIFTPNVGDTAETHQQRVVRYADECGSDAKAAKAFGIDDYRTIRQWRRESES